MGLSLRTALNCWSHSPDCVALRPASCSSHSGVVARQLEASFLWTHVADSVELLLGHLDEIAVAPNACVYYNDIESTEDFAGLIGYAPDAAAIRDIVGASNYLATKRSSFIADFVHPTWRRRRCRRSRCRDRARRAERLWQLRTAHACFKHCARTSRDDHTPVKCCHHRNSAIAIPSR